MKCLRLVCLFSLFITPIFAATGNDSWEDLCALTKKSNIKPSDDGNSDNESDSSDTEETCTTKNDQLAACQLYLLDMRTNIDNVFNALRGDHPKIDDAIAALSQCQCLLSAKVPTMLQELQRLKELQDASAQSNGDNEKEDNV